MPFSGALPQNTIFVCTLYTRLTFKFARKFIIIMQLGVLFNHLYLLVSFSSFIIVGFFSPNIVYVAMMCFLKIFQYPWPSVPYFNLCHSKRDDALRLTTGKMEKEYSCYANAMNFVG